MSMLGYGAGRRKCRRDDTIRRPHDLATMATLFFVILTIICVCDAKVVQHTRRSGWWWGEDQAHMTRPHHVAVQLPPQTQVGDLFSFPCESCTASSHCQRMHLLHRVSKEMVQQISTNNTLNIVCSTPKLDEDKWARRQLENSEMLQEMAKFSKAKKDVGAAGWIKVPQTFEMKGIKQCNDKGLIHKLMNLEGMIKLAWFLNSTLEVPTLLEPYDHTGCGVPNNGLPVNWAYIMNFTNTPTQDFDNGPAAAKVRSKKKGLEMQLSWDSRELYDLRRSVRATNLSKHRAIIVPAPASFPWCTYYKRTSFWGAYFLPWSSSVLSAAAEIATTMHFYGTTRSNHNDTLLDESGGTGESTTHETADHIHARQRDHYDAVHFRMGDKANAVGDPLVGLPVMNSDELFRRIFAHLGAPREATSAQNSKISNSANRIGKVISGRPLYIATDSPTVLRLGRGAIALRHHFPHVFTLEDIRDVIIRHCTEPQLFEQCSGTPFFVMAVEMAVMERANRFVATERSLPSRRVALVRNRNREAERAATAAVSISLKGGDSSTNSKRRLRQEPLMYLYGSLQLHILSPQVSTPEWEAATLRSDEQAIASLDVESTAKATERYNRAGILLNDTRCMRAYGVKPGTTMKIQSAGLDISKVNNESFVTQRNCCERCFKQKSSTPLKRDNGCSLWLWEAAPPLLEPPWDMSKVEVAHDGAHSRMFDFEHNIGHCSLWSGDISIAAATSSRGQRAAFNTVGNALGKKTFSTHHRRVKVVSGLP
mmetsp:Transcript_77961/g.156048  ORF Transcript_77961/g.156048 Transcript_77961/m.156048 type:complete len:765 (+) Transcript_77961:71-2365(+)